MNYREYLSRRKNCLLNDDNSLRFLLVSCFCKRWDLHRKKKKEISLLSLNAFSFRLIFSRSKRCGTNRNGISARARGRGEKKSKKQNRSSFNYRNSILNKPACQFEAQLTRPCMPNGDFSVSVLRETMDPVKWSEANDEPHGNRITRCVAIFYGNCWSYLAGRARIGHIRDAFTLDAHRAGGNRWFTRSAYKFSLMFIEFISGAPINYSCMTSGW